MYENELPTLRKILTYVARETQIPERRILSRSHQRDLVHARRIFTQRARWFNFPYMQIGAFLKRDHSTILRLVQK
jgi:chromosomal replication initiation ATPase DnaA